MVDSYLLSRMPQEMSIMHFEEIAIEWALLNSIRFHGLLGDVT